MKNIFFSLITIIFFLGIIFSTLNIILSGVPLFNILNLKISDAVFISKKEEDQNRNKILYNKEHYIDKCGISEGGFYNLAYKKDIFGFRENDDNLFYNTDLVILGDSFGISTCVNYPNDLTSQLKNLLKTKKILNISVGGTGPYYQKEMLIHLFNKNDTKFNSLVWLFYEGNDHGDLKKNYGKIYNFNFEINRNNIGTIGHADHGKTTLKVNYSPSENIIILKLKLFFANYFRGFGSFVKYFKTYPPLLPNEEQYDNVVKDLSNYLNKKNIEKKIIFYIPAYTRLSYKDTTYFRHPHLKHFDQLKLLVEKTAEKYNFKFVDGAALFSKHKDPLSNFNYRLPTHFNIEGYRSLAQFISDELN